jgi:(p)ppGpp synthase/HD superfamily hydrolase
MSIVKKKYSLLLRAFDFAEPHHQGFRKDGVTPEFSHQLNILGFLLTQTKNMDDPAIVLALSLLHDTLEDNGHLKELIHQNFKKIFKYINTISKVRLGVKLSNDEYYPPLAKCPICSIAKGADRLQNLTTSVGVMSVEKLEEAVIETRSYVLPMLKEASERFPKQFQIYQLLKSLININLTHIEYAIQNDFKI